MSYHHDKQNSPLIEIAFIVAVVALVFAVVYATPFISWVSEISHRTFDGGLHDQTAIKDTTRDANMIMGMSQKKLVDRVQSLQEELLQNKLALLDVDRLKKENESLRAFTKAGVSEDRVIATVHIIKRPPQSSYDTVILDGGEHQGIRKGQQVIIDGTVYLGDVVEVFPETSVVALMTTQGISRDIQSVRTDVVVSAVGHNGSHVVLEIPRDVDIIEGDQFIDVLSHKLSLMVYKVTFDDREPFKTVYARSPINLRYLDWVQVVE